MHMIFKDFVCYKCRLSTLRKAGKKIIYSEERTENLDAL